MQTKLTLRLDDALIKRAKRHARRSGQSLSEVVADFFSRLNSGEPPAARELTPAVRRLAGALAGKPLDEAAHGRHLEGKYRR